MTFDAFFFLSPSFVRAFPLRGPKALALYSGTQISSSGKIGNCIYFSWRKEFLSIPFKSTQKFNALIPALQRKARVIRRINVEVQKQDTKNLLFGKELAEKIEKKSFASILCQKLWAILSLKFPKRFKDFQVFPEDRADYAIFIMSYTRLHTNELRKIDGKIRRLIIAFLSLRESKILREGSHFFYKTFD